MGDIAIQRIKREFKEVIKSDEVNYHYYYYIVIVESLIKIFII